MALTAPPPGSCSPTILLIIIRAPGSSNSSSGLPDHPTRSLRRLSRVVPYESYFSREAWLTGGTPGGGAIELIASEVRSDSDKSEPDAVCGMGLAAPRCINSMIGVESREVVRRVKSRNGASGQLSEKCQQGRPCWYFLC